MRKHSCVKKMYTPPHIHRATGLMRRETLPSHSKSDFSPTTSTAILIFVILVQKNCSKKILSATHGWGKESFLGLGQISKWANAVWKQKKREFIKCMQIIWLK